MRATALFALILAAGIGTAAAAEPIAGTWRTEADRKGQKGHVEVTACGSGWCGTIVSVETADGAPVTTPNIGRQVLIGMAAEGGGRYRGEVFVPIMGANFAAEATVRGSQLALRACNAVGICRNQTWLRMN
ncbi:MAG: DUF2147 domain-containing protein [Pseudomonadota bacterium]